MFVIAGHMAKPNKLTFFEGTHGYPRGKLVKKWILLNSSGKSGHFSFKR